MLIWEDRSELTPKDAQKAGRDRLPSRVPCIPFAIDGEDAGFVRPVRRSSIGCRDLLQAAAGEIFDLLLLGGSSVWSEAKLHFGRCIAEWRVSRRFPDRNDREASEVQADDILRHLSLQNTP